MGGCSPKTEDIGTTLIGVVEMALGAEGISRREEVSRRNNCEVVAPVSPVDVTNYPLEN